MTVRPAVVLARLAHLGRAIAQLERLRSMPATTRESDPLMLLAAERALHVAAEAAFDIGHHVLAGRGRQVPAAYREDDLRELHACLSALPELGTTS